MRAALAVLAHDLGKCCAGFQQMLRDGSTFGERHEVLSVALLPWLLGADTEGDLEWVAAAVLSHHKDLDEIHRLYRPADPYTNLADGLERLTRHLTAEFYDTAQRLFLEEIEPIPISSPMAGVTVPLAPDSTAAPVGGVSELRRQLNAALRLLDSVDRRPYNSPSSLAGRFLRGALLMADHAGSAWESLAWAADLKSPQRMIEALGIAEAGMFDHQRKASCVAGNGVLIAPTGSGKTEASILWAAHVSSGSPGYPVIFYVLPYQASLNAMRARLGEKLGGNKVSLQHSRALQALYRQLLDREYDSRTASRLAAREVALSRLHASPMRILTPYQLLRGAFQLKGHEAIWTDASGGLMIFDEIHAYETGRLSMILATLKHLARDLGVRAFLMSATLPSCLLRVLQDLLPDCCLVQADAGTFAKFRRHRLHLLDQDLLADETVRAIASAAGEGLGVLAVCTTVGRAQQLWQSLTRRLGEGVELLHGRFNAEDRFVKERRLLARRGGKSAEPLVLVATQVVEVSLDVDFDILYSDPAPLEALLQRFGRVNRRRRVALRDVFVTTLVPEGAPVYEERLVQLGLSELRKTNGEPLDESEIQAVLDRVYSGDFGGRWANELRAGLAAFETRVLSSLKPFHSDERVEAAFEELFDGLEVLPKSLDTIYQTRLENEPLQAPALMVPVTRGQYFSLRSRGLVEWRNGIPIADCTYSSEFGLEVRERPEIDGV